MLAYAYRVSGTRYIALRREVSSYILLLLLPLVGTQFLSQGDGSETPTASPHDLNSALPPKVIPSPMHAHSQNTKQPIQITPHAHRTYVRNMRTCTEPTYLVQCTCTYTHTCPSLKLHGLNSQSLSWSRQGTSTPRGTNTDPSRFAMSSSGRCTRQRRRESPPPEHIEKQGRTQDTNSQAEILYFGI